MTAHHSIFPLTVSEGHISITPEAKDEMFDVFMTQLNAQGNTMDFLGYNRLHLEPDLDNLYTAILSIVHEHFRALNVDPDDLQFNVVKSWLNIKTTDKKIVFTTTVRHTTRLRTTRTSRTNRRCSSDSFPWTCATKMSL